MQVSPVMKRQIYSQKLVPPCQLTRSHALSPQSLSKSVTPNWRRHISHSHLNFQIPEVSSEELLLSRPICCELSRLRCHGHSLLLSSYLHRISRKENSACSACRHPQQDLNPLLLDCPASEPRSKSIFGSSLSILDLWSRPWGVARLLGFRGVPSRPIPRKGSGRTTTMHHSQTQTVLIGWKSNISSQSSVTSR